MDEEIRCRRCGEPEYPEHVQDGMCAECRRQIEREYVEMIEMDRREDDRE